MSDANPDDISPIDDSFSWEEFENLQGFCVNTDPVDQLKIPDDAYQQIKSLNDALVRKAHELIRKEAELENRITEFEQRRAEFDARFWSATHERVEKRLEKIVAADRNDSVPGRIPVEEFQKAVDACLVKIEQGLFEDFDPQALKSDPDFVLPQVAPVIDADQSQQSADLDESSLPNLESTAPLRIDHDTPESDTPHDQIAETLGGTLRAEPITQSHDPLQSADRLQKSAADLREKSEVISAVFVELDQMVRDLGRQQELLDQIQVNQNPRSIEEFKKISEKLRKRFRRLTHRVST